MAGGRSWIVLALAVVVCSNCVLFAASASAQQRAMPPQQPANPLTADKAKPASGVKLRGLNKVTARTSILEAKLGEPMAFGNLIIIATACWIAPSDVRPEQAALLAITEAKPDTGETLIFSGWMFASSPALSALEHPVYDITLLKCKE